MNIPNCASNSNEFSKRRQQSLSNVYCRIRSLATPICVSLSDVQNKLYHHQSRDWMGYHHIAISYESLRRSFTHYEFERVEGTKMTAKPKQVALVLAGIDCTRKNFLDL